MYLTYCVPSDPGENKIVFKVFGLESTSDEFRTGVMEMLENRLTDKVIEVLLKNVIGRKNKLTFDDVRFIQVWTLTQFYIVIAFFHNLECPLNQAKRHLTVSLFLCCVGNYVQGKVEGP